MANQAEIAFAKTFLNTLSTQPVTYADDYQQPPENSLKKVPILPIDLPPPPERPDEDVVMASQDGISITIKSLKPPASFSLTVDPTDTISDIKSKLAAQPTAPPPDVQRLLLKGKALVDTKLLKDYNIADGATVTLMFKPGYEWDPTKPSPQPSPPSPTPSITLVDAAKAHPAGGRKHQRIPSVVLSPSPGSSSPVFDKPIDITLSLDAPPSLSPDISSYHTTVSKPEFWGRLRNFLRNEFAAESDALQAWEDFLVATKGTLTASEIAKIRDEVGVIGMAGT
ncbi:hypothetical protein ONZ45_g5971 [Pleurotus djamor]|nr:hypothetical protein ONZ45_g5971 [Pleurotus djamor]